MPCFRKLIVTFHKINGNLKKALKISRVVFFTRHKTKLDRAIFGIGYCGTRRGGGGEIPLPPLNTENIKAMITILKGQLERLKLFPLRSATSADSVI